jgi:hypothetical protein
MLFVNATLGSNYLPFDGDKGCVIHIRSGAPFPFHLCSPRSHPIQWQCTMFSPAPPPSLAPVVRPSRPPNPSVTLEYHSETNESHPEARDPTFSHTHLTPMVMPSLPPKPSVTLKSHSETIKYHPDARKPAIGCDQQVEAHNIQYMTSKTPSAMSSATPSEAHS